MIWNYARLRALRVEVDVRLALGTFSIDQAADYLRTAVPMDAAAARSEASAIRPATPASRRRACSVSPISAAIDCQTLHRPTAQRHHPSHKPAVCNIGRGGHPSPVR